MGSFSITHWIILLVVVVLVFGTAKFKNAGKDIGAAVKGFKDAVKSDDKPDDTTQLAQNQPIEGEAKVKQHDKV